MEIVGEWWRIQCCARNVKIGFLADVKNKESYSKMHQIGNTFSWPRYKEMVEKTVALIKKWCDKVEVMNELCYL